MPQKYRNGREVKPGNAVVGTDWRGGIVVGAVITGRKDQGNPEFIFQHGLWKTACPSLHLENFLHVEDAGTDAEKAAVEAYKVQASVDAARAQAVPTHDKPAAPTGPA
jgi:hypothetical protein